MSVQCPRPFAGNQLSVSHIEQLRRYARSLELRTSTGAGIRTERGPEGTRISVDRPPARAGSSFDHAFRCRLSTRPPGAGEGDNPIHVVHVRPGEWSTAGSGGTPYPPATTPAATESQWVWAESTNEMVLDIPFGSSDTADGYVLLVFNFVRGDRTLPELWWSRGSGAPSPIPPGASVPSGSNGVRFIPLCKITQTANTANGVTSLSYSLLQLQMGMIRLFVPPYSAPTIERGMLATLNPLRRQAAPGDSIYMYDDSTPPELVQVTATGGEEYFDSDGNPVYSGIGEPWIADWLRFADADDEAVFEPPLPVP